MTEWRDWAAWRKIVAVANDRVGSAAAVAAEAARAVEAFARTVAAVGRDAFPDAVLDAVDLLHQRQAAMAPITNLRNLVYLASRDDPETVVAALVEFGDRLAASTERLSKVGSDLIQDGATILVHSHSSSVQALLETAGATRSFRVCCTESLPTGEGIEMASELASLGFEVELVPDDSVVELLGGIDLVLAGADALGPDRVINKSGTAELAREAHRAGVPFFLVASTDKALPAALFEMAVHRSARSGLSEVVALSELKGVITELGVLEPAEIGRLAADRNVAPELG